MAIGYRLRQTAGEVVSLEGWMPDDDNPVGPQGAKPKRLVICPNPPPAPFLIGGHRYLFKHPSGFRASQVWSEVICYELMRDAGLPIPPAFLAYDALTGSFGVLVEFFYGYVEDAPARHVNAVEFFQGEGIELNETRGSIHNNVVLCRLMQTPGWRPWWAGTLAFDALVGNTDRHSQNWGFVARFGEVGRPRYELSPVFDNGTSLGATVQDASLAAFLRPPRLADFLRKGRHHNGWIGGDADASPFVELCRRYVAAFGGKEEMLRIVAVSDHRIDDVLAWASTFDFGVQLVPARLAFVRAQLMARRGALLAMLEA